MPAANSTRLPTKFPAVCTASASRWSTRYPKLWKSRSSATAKFISKVTSAAIRRRRLKEVGKSKERGTQVTFKPDSQIFETTDFSFDILSQRLRELAFLNRGVKITIDDERTQKKHEFFYKGGLVSFVEHLNRAKTAIHPKVVYFEGEKDGVGVEIAMQWNDGYRRTSSPSPTTSTPSKAART